VGCDVSACYDDTKFPSELVQMFPRQAAGDAAFTVATIEKRLTRSTAERNERNLVQRQEVGYALWHVMARGLDLPHEVQEFDAHLYERCVRDQMQSRLTKTRATLAQADERADPWNTAINHVRNFIKTQDKAKLEAWYLEEAKAGQTISAVREDVLAKWGPAFRYATAVLMQRVRPGIILNKGLSPRALNEVVSEQWRPKGLSTINDYSNFDATQGGESVVLELAVLQWSGLPDYIVQGYAHWKTHIVTSFIGLKQTSRDSGEPGTWDGNTWYNIANCALKFGYQALRRGTWLFSGDDMACDQHLTDCDTWYTKWANKIHTISKLQHTANPDFCGWLLTPRGIMRSPLLVVLKMWYKRARSPLSVGNWVDSYATEIAFTYRLAPLASEWLTEIDVLCLSHALDYFHRKTPVLSIILFGRRQDWLAALKAKFDRVTEHRQWPRRKSLLRSLRAAIDRASGFSVRAPYLSPITCMSHQWPPSLNNNNSKLKLQSPAFQAQIAGHPTTTPSPMPVTNFHSLLTFPFSVVRSKNPWRRMPKPVSRQTSPPGPVMQPGPKGTPTLKYVACHTSGLIWTQLLSALCASTWAALIALAFRLLKQLRRFRPAYLILLLSCANLPQSALALPMPGPTMSPWSISEQFPPQLPEKWTSERSTASLTSSTPSDLPMFLRLLEWYSSWGPLLCLLVASAAFLHWKYCSSAACPTSDGSQLTSVGILCLPVLPIDNMHFTSHFAEGKEILELVVGGKVVVATQDKLLPREGEVENYKAKFSMADAQDMLNSLAEIRARAAAAEAVIEQLRSKIVEEGPGAEVGLPDDLREKVRGHTARVKALVSNVRRIMLS
jgi:hypothetical protein